jgi:hypothetical protein
MFQAGDKVVLDTNIPKRSQHIHIHPGYLTDFPAELKKGSLGEIIEYTNDRSAPYPIFVRFMLKPPNRWEQPFLKGNVVAFSLQKHMAGFLKRQDW